jgi:hypothetical protein
MSHTETSNIPPIALPAWLQHLIVPILMLVAVLGAGLPTLFGALDAAHGNELLIAGAASGYGGILVGAILTFWVTPTWLKLSLQILALLGTLVAPFLAKGTFDAKVDGPILAIAVANGLLTAFGQYVRTQTATKPLLDARTSGVVTSVPANPQAVTELPEPEYAAVQSDKLAAS